MTMTTDQARPILSALLTAQRAMRESSLAFDEALAGLRAQLDSIAAANHAQGEAMSAITTATQEILALIDGAHQ